MLDEPSPGNRHWTSTWNLLTIAAVLLAVVAVILEVIPVDYYALAPGDALAVEPLIHVQGHPTPAHAGTLYMVDVSLIPINHLLEKLYWQTQPHVEIDKAQAVAGNLSNAQYIKANVVMMQQSIQTAEVVALRLSGRHIQFKDGPIIVYILPHFPAVGKLKKGDIVKAVNGHPTPTIEKASLDIKSYPPGSTVHLTVVRNGQTIQIAVKTRGVRPGPHRKKVSVVGFQAQNRVILPFKIRITPGNIGGPSAGLMFTLGLVERLDRHGLTHGCPVAGTGEIFPDGSVGPIGGAAQKVVAAEQHGARYFLVPNSGGNTRDAMSARSGITILSVGSARQALRDLGKLKPCR